MYLCKVLQTIWLVLTFLSVLPISVVTGTKTLDPKEDPSNVPFFDLTNAINQKNVSEIEHALSISPNIYYSTDGLVSEILDWADVADLISYLEEREDQHPPICLTLSFKMTKNTDQIDYRYIQDVLYILPKSTQINETGTKALKKYLCNIVLDFQSFDYFGKLAEDSMKYLSKWGISFTRNAKQLLQNILGFQSENFTTPQVGVAYNERQIGKDKLLLEQELCYADFLIVNVTYIPFVRMAPIYNIFEQEVKTLYQKNQEFLASLQENCTTNKKPPQVSFMFTWVLGNNVPDIRPDEKVIFEKEDTFFDIFQSFVGTLIKTQNVRFEIISGALFNPEKFTNWWLDNPSMHQMLPYLYTHSVDTTLCQLDRMIEKIESRFSKLVVNEFTWSALARFNQIKSRGTKNDCVNQSHHHKTEMNVILLTTVSLGNFWNQTGNSLATLVRNYPTIGKLNLDTIIFRQSEKKKDYEGYESNQDGTKLSMDSQWGQDLQDFVHDWLKVTDSNKIGCLVEFNRDITYSRNRVYKEVQKRCQPIFKQASVLIIQYTLESMADITNNFTEFNPRKHPGNWFMKDIMNLFIARKYLLNKYVFKRIILKIVTKDGNGINLDSWSKGQCSSYLHYEWILLQNLYRWAEVYDVEMITKPVFDLKHPALGYWKPPQKDGGSAEYHAFCDY